VKCVVSESVLDVVEECSDLLVALVRHALQHLLNEVRLVTATGLDDQLAWGSSLFERRSSISISSPGGTGRGLRLTASGMLTSSSAIAV